MLAIGAPFARNSFVCLIVSLEADTRCLRLPVSAAQLDHLQLTQLSRKISFLHVIKQKLLKTHATSEVFNLAGAQMRALVEMEESGLVPMLVGDRYEDLGRMYSLFRRVDLRLSHCLVV